MSGSGPERDSDVLRSALDTARAVAREEFEHATRAASEVRESIQELGERARTFERGLEEVGAVPEVSESLGEVGRSLDQLAQQHLQDVELSLAAKQRRLKQFTFALFGRTMAGKSTIREAIMGGDGSTIGKGGQRTTRDVREYDWRNLQIIDTPGIAAYAGEEDRQKAMSIVGESDLILFLLDSDSIQQEVFEHVRLLRLRSKPVLFVLNVKKDLTEPIRMKRFLRAPDSVLGEEAIEGHLSRLRRLAQEQLGMEDVRVVPLHAQAAFLATRPEHAGQADALHHASRIDKLLDVMSEEVCQRGCVRRIQTLIDGTASGLFAAQSALADEVRQIRQAADLMRSKLEELDAWASDYAGSLEERIRQEADRRLNLLRADISGFVDRYVKDPDIAMRWQKWVKEKGITEQWLQRRQEEVWAEVQSRVEEFGRELRVEAVTLTASAGRGPDPYEGWDPTRSLNRLSTGGVAVAGIAKVAAIYGAANVWNPLGWTALAVGLGALGISWLSGDDDEKLNDHKKAVNAKLRDQVDDMADAAVKAVVDWFEQQVVRNVDESRSRLEALHRGLDELAVYGGKAVAGCARQADRLNRRLLIQVAKLSGFSGQKFTIKRILRKPGYRTKLISNNGVPTAQISEQLETVLGEPVDVVPDSSTNRMVAAALRPASVRASEVRIGGEGQFVVNLPMPEMEKARGPGGRNVEMANELLNMSIQLRTKG